MKNRFKLEIESKTENISLARIAISGFVSQKNILMDELMDIKTAVSEAITNSIVHGYEGKNGNIIIECSYNDDEIDIEVIDYGKGIENIDEAMQMMYTYKPNEEFAGMGFTIMENFMDEIIVESVFGKGTRIRLRKKLKVLSNIKQKVVS